MKFNDNFPNKIQAETSAFLLINSAQTHDRRKPHEEEEKQKRKHFDHQQFHKLYL